MKVFSPRHGAAPAGHTEDRAEPRRPHGHAPRARASGSRARRRAASAICCAPATMPSWSGIETALADDPSLTCRLPGLEAALAAPRRARQPACGWATGPSWPRRRRQVPTLVFTTAGSDGGALDGLRRRGDPGRGRCARPARSGAVLRALAERGITRLLVEGGAIVHAGLPQSRAWRTGWRSSPRPWCWAAPARAPIGALAALGAGRSPAIS